MKKEMPNSARIKSGPLGSTDEDGANGAFLFSVTSNNRRINCTILCIVSDSLGWEHVSVTVKSFQRCPTWEEMALVKSIFWDEEETVVQYHPAKSDYVNNHPFCLHLWKPTIQALPKPDPKMVGVRDFEGMG